MTRAQTQDLTELWRKTGAEAVAAIKAFVKAIEDLPPAPWNGVVRNVQKPK